MDNPARVQIMEEAISLTQGDRQEEYGSFYKNMQNQADITTAFLRGKYGIDFDLTAEDAAMFMVLAKIIRTYQHEANPKRDTYVDGASYFAMGGEAAEKDRLEKADVKV